MMYYPITNCSKPLEHKKVSETNNDHIYLPTELWEHIINFCNLQEIYNLSMSCRYSHLVITPILQRKIYQKKVPSNCLSYSITSYKSFIGPILESLDIKTKTIIDEYLQQNKDNKNIDKIFCEFVFKQLHDTAKKIRTAKGLVTKLFLKNLMHFAVNSKSNHCAIIYYNPANLISICQINFPLELKELSSINCLNHNEYIIAIQFTPENNLLVTVQKHKEEHSIKFILLQLNLENGNETVKLWEHKIDHTPDDDLSLFYSKTIMFPHSNDKQLFLIVDEKIYLFKIENSSYSIQRFIIPYSESHLHEVTSDLIFSSNGSELAVIEGNNSSNMLHLFARNSNKEIFTEKSFPKHQYLLSCSTPYNSYTRDLKFNTSGNVCVYINNYYELVMLNKMFGEWHCAMVLSDASYLYLGLTFDEQNLIVSKHYKDSTNNTIDKTLEVISIGDKMLKSASAPCYIRRNNKITSLRHKNFYPLAQQTRSKTFIIHPSGLAVFVYYYLNEFKYTVDVIIPRQLAAEEKKYLPLKKVAYYIKTALT